VVQRVDGLKPGIYHYSVEHHGLNLVRPGLFEDKMVELFSGQEWVRDASVLFFMTACLERSMWKYPFSRAYRVVLFDAGHLSQTCCLVSTSLELGVFVTAALQDRSIEKELRIDGVRETALYGIAIGRAK
jgi:SagB-type dehydrogenase family enzyme